MLARERERERASDRDRTKKQSNISKQININKHGLEYNVRNQNIHTLTAYKRTLTSNTNFNFLTLLDCCLYIVFFLFTLLYTQKSPQSDCVNVARLSFLHSICDGYSESVLPLICQIRWGDRFFGCNIERIFAQTAHTAHTHTNTHTTHRAYIRPI